MTYLGGCGSRSPSSCSLKPCLGLEDPLHTHSCGCWQEPSVPHRLLVRSLDLSPHRCGFKVRPFEYPHNMVAAFQEKAEEAAVSFRT